MPVAGEIKSTAGCFANAPMNAASLYFAASFGSPSADLPSEEKAMNIPLKLAAGAAFVYIKP